MARGEEPFSVEKAKTIFATYQKVATAHTLWPDTSKTGGETASLPAIWENKADFDAKLTKFGQRSQGRRGDRDGSRHLQGAIHRGAEELRRVPPDLPQAPELIWSIFRKSGNRFSAENATTNKKTRPLPDSLETGSGLAFDRRRAAVRPDAPPFCVYEPRPRRPLGDATCYASS